MRYTSLRVHSKQKFQKYDDFTFCTEDTRCSECGWKLCNIRSLVVRIPQQGCPSPTIEGTCDQVSFKSKKKRIKGVLYPPPPFSFKQRTILVFRIPLQGCRSSAIEGTKCRCMSFKSKKRIGGVRLHPPFFFSFFFNKDGLYLSFEFLNKAVQAQLLKVCII